MNGPIHKKKDILKKKKQSKKDSFLTTHFNQSNESPNQNIYGIVTVKTCRNNMIFTLTDSRGNTKAIRTGGSLGYRNAQKKTWTTVRECAKEIVRKAKKDGFRYLYLNIKGHCRKRHSALIGLVHSGAKIAQIIHRVPTPHNGCRAIQKRRK